MVDVIRNKKCLLFKLKINRDLIIFFLIDLDIIPASGTDKNTVTIDYNCIDRYTFLQQS